MMRGLLVSVVALVMLSAPVLATPLPGLNGTTAETIPVIGRLFPEPLETNDYIGYFEASDSFDVLNQRYPDIVEVLRVGKSFGLLNRLTGQVDKNDVFLVEITNEKSPIPFDQKIHLVFTCSVHGNEKGGREGCMRVIEDFAKGIGLAADEPKLAGWLDYMVLAFGFTNTDGWAHDEPEYFSGAPGTMYTRENGNGSDLNRQWPTVGFLEIDQSHKTMAEPEVAAMAPFMRDRYTNTWYAIDIHGMLNPADGGSPPPVSPGPQAPTDFQSWLADNDKGHFVLGLLSSQMLNQDEFFRQTRMAELIRERMEGCPGRIGQAYCNAPSTGAWGGSYNYWGTSWETIGYTSTGTTSMYMGNPYGLNAPAASYEMAYNHMVCDGVYLGCGDVMNEFHVNNVRMMVQALMEAASIDFQVSLETEGARTAYVYNPKIVSTAGPDGAGRPSTGWSDENTLDDRWDILHNVFLASPMDFFRDMRGYVRNGDQPGVFDEVNAASINDEMLARYDQLVIAGSTLEVVGNTQLGQIKKWVEAGGRLILTDQSMKLLETMGVVGEGSVLNTTAYVGYTDVVDYTHPIAQNLVGYSRMTLDQTVIGIPQNQAPIWYLAQSEAASKGKVVGVISGGALGTASNANLGEIALGQGTIRYLGVLLPDPTMEHYTPYGLGGYGVTYAGNQFMHNLLGFKEVFDAPPRVFEDEGSLRRPVGGPESTPESAPGADGEVLDADPGSTPSVGFVGVLAAAVVGIVVVARRKD
jgi:hypothetical protein